MSVWTDISSGRYENAPELRGPIGEMLAAAKGLPAEETPNEDAALRGLDPVAAERVRVQQVAYTGALIGMAADLERKDGAEQVAGEAIPARFRETYQLGKGGTDKAEAIMAKLFSEARTSGKSIDHYAEKAREVFGDSSPALGQMMEGLVAIAHADMKVDKAEREKLDRAAHIFGISSEIVDEMHNRHSRGKGDGSNEVIVVGGQVKEVSADEKDRIRAQMEEEARRQQRAEEAQEKEAEAKAKAKREKDKEFLAATIEAQARAKERIQESRRRREAFFENLEGGDRRRDRDNAGAESAELSQREVQVATAVAAILIDQAMAPAEGASAAAVPSTFRFPLAAAMQAGRGGRSA